VIIDVMKIIKFGPAKETANLKRKIISVDTVIL
jgi:hypothetical protein